MSMEVAQQDPLYTIRHSLAHVMAQAILQLRPTAKLAFGPPIDNGCYYDFLFQEPLTPEDFDEIEKRMRKIINQKQVFEGRILPAAEAVSYLEQQGQYFKVEYCKELIEKGETTIGFFKNGPFDDMCAGPHVAHTGEIPADAFAIDSIAGAYWRGSEKNPQLTRVYCLAFGSKAELKAYLEKRKLALERDHRKLGKELELFMISDQIGPGLPLWMPNGAIVKDALETLAKEVEARAGYVRVHTPVLAKEELFITSGHLPYYADGMFPKMTIEGEANYYLKSMNCPLHHAIYAHRPRSYRELPLRLAEFGHVHRFEPSGTLSGLLRVRSICQNDAHIYCTIDQVKEEIRATFEMALEYYRRFRFEDISVRFSTHDPVNKEKFVDNPELWRYSEEIVEQVLKDLGANYFVGKGEAAFYGPKIDIQAKTMTGREESIGTTQLDFAQPLRFNLTYIGPDGKEHRPYLVHRAPLGSTERFLAFLIEHLGGAFPTWMAPTQVMVIPVGGDFAEYAREIERELRAHLIRVAVDDSDNSFNKKIREAVTKKIPTMLIVGAREKEERTVTIRRYAVKEQEALPLAALVERMKRMVAERTMDCFGDVPLP